MPKLSAELQQYFFAPERSPHVRLGDILVLAGERAFGFLFVLLSLPSALPIPAPGYSIPFGVVMFVLAAQMVLGKQRPRLPEAWLERAIALKTVQGVLDKGTPWLRRLEWFCRPRLKPLCASLPGRVVLGVAIALMSVSMMVPIPGTNTLPAIGIFVIGLGLLEDDGAIALAGLAVCGAALTLTTAIVLFGYELVKAFVFNLLNVLR